MYDCDAVYVHLLIIKLIPLFQINSTLGLKW